MCVLSLSFLLGIVILSQPNKYHESLFKEKESDILKQNEGLNQVNVK